MDLFALLRTATVRAQSECELPDYLAKRVLAVADNPELYPQAEAELRALLDMLPDYDTYGQTGYMGMGVSNSILEGALRRLELQRKNSVADQK
jgi:hypothetical protein